MEKRISLSLLLMLVMIAYSQQFSVPYSIIEEKQSNLRGLLDDQCEINTMKHNRFYIADIVLGGQNLKMKISTSLQGLWVGDSSIIKSSYDKSKSKTYQMIERYKSSKYGEGIVSTDIFEIPQVNIRIEQFPFFLVDTTTYTLSSYHGYFGLGFSFQDDSRSKTKAAFNFFDYLQSQAKTTSIVGFYSKSYDHGQIAFGDLPKEVKSDMKRYKKCRMVPIVGKPYYWPCVLDSVYFGDYKMYRVGDILGFSLGASLMTVDYDFLMYFRDNYLHYEFDNGICKFKGTKFYQIECKMDKFSPKDFTDISFVLGKITIKLKGEHLFYEHNKLYKSIMISFENVKYWRIPPSILLGYYVFYDRLNGELGFYKMDK